MMRTTASVLTGFCLVVSAMNLAWAGERSFQISCPATSQATFDKAVSMMETQQSEAHKLFLELEQKDPDCPILCWGLTLTAGDIESKRKWFNEMIYEVAVEDTNEVERQHIAVVPAP